MHDDDIAPLIALVDDPKHPMNPDGTYRLSDAQARAILDLRLQRLTALGRDEIGEELTKPSALSNCVSHGAIISLSTKPRNSRLAFGRPGNQ